MDKNKYYKYIVEINQLLDNFIEVTSPSSVHIININIITNILYV